MLNLISVLLIAACLAMLAVAGLTMFEVILPVSLPLAR